MSDYANVKPLLLFKTLKNTELGASGVEVESDGTVVLHGVLKQVTEGMLTSYPRTQLGHWLPNRLRVRYTPDEVGGRNIRDFETGEALDADGLAALSG